MENNDIDKITQGEDEIIRAIEGKAEFFNDVRQPKKKMFLAAYCEVGTVTKAAQIADIDRSTHYNWMINDKDYPKWFAKAEQHAHEKIEAEIKRRAIDGILRPVYYQGQIVGHTREYSDNLLMFYAKAAMPEKYKERIQNDVNVMPVNIGGVNTLKQLKEAEETNPE